MLRNGKTWQVDEETGRRCLIYRKQEKSPNGSTIMETTSVTCYGLPIKQISTQLTQDKRFWTDIQMGNYLFRDWCRITAKVHWSCSGSKRRSNAWWRHHVGFLLHFITCLLINRATVHGPSLLSQSPLRYSGSRLLSTTSASASF